MANPKIKQTNITPDTIFNSDGDHEEPPFHLITTDHPYMATLGLSAFTTGTLYRWWNQKDGEGKYENHKKSPKFVCFADFHQQTTKIPCA